MSDDNHEFEKGETIPLDELPDSDHLNSGNLENMGNGTLYGQYDDQLVKFNWDSVEVTEVKYLTDDGDVVEERDNA